MSFTYNPPNESMNAKLQKLFNLKNAFLEYHPSKCIMTVKLKELLPDILNFEVRKDDVWFCSYPRTGSTWTQEMIWLLGSDLDYEKAKSIPQIARAPNLELSTFFFENGPDLGKLGENSVEYTRNYPSPRFIKCHLPLPFLPTQIHTVKPKIIHTVRNAKDVSVSYYHYLQLIHGLEASFDFFIECFLEGAVPMGSYWEHCRQFSKIENEPNVLVLKYEEMNKDLKNAIRQTAKFLEKDITEEQVEELNSYLSFDSMKNNKAVNLENLGIGGKGKSFIRNGKVGDWKNYMDESVSKRFDEMSKDVEILKCY